MNADTPQSEMQHTPDSAVLGADMDGDDPGDAGEVIITIGERLVIMASTKADSDWGWVPEATTVQGRAFVKLNAKSRALAKIIGLNVGVPDPFKDYEGLKLLKQLRNKDVDDFMTTTLRCDLLEIKHRERSFEKACVPLIIDLKLPPDDAHASVLTTIMRQKTLRWK